MWRALQKKVSTQRFSFKLRRSRRCNSHAILSTESRSRSDFLTGTEKCYLENNRFHDFHQPKVARRGRKFPSPRRKFPSCLLSRFWRSGRAWESQITRQNIMQAHHDSSSMLKYLITQGMLLPGNDFACYFLHQVRDG